MRPRRKAVASTVITCIIVSLMTALPDNVSVHAVRTGTVCFSNTATSCPPVATRLSGNSLLVSALNFTGKVGSQLVVRVVIQGSAPFDYFNIQVDPASPCCVQALSPVSVDLNSSVLPGLTSESICIRGTATTTNTTCASWAPNSSEAVQVIASGGTTSGPGTTGLLFTITYDILARTNDTNLLFENNVTPLGHSCACVHVLDSNGNNLPENLEISIFENFLFGDVNGDCVVNVVDMALVALAFDSTPSSSNWNASADVNNDGVVNLLDLTLVGLNFGKICT